jgi:hypothetical protein
VCACVCVCACICKTVRTRGDKAMSGTFAVGTFFSGGLKWVPTILPLLLYEDPQTMRLERYHVSPR